MLLRIATCLTVLATANADALGAPVNDKIFQFKDNAFGRLPEGGLVQDAQGRLYGVTTDEPRFKGAAGTVYRLTPPVGPRTTWAIATLAVFQTGHGSAPNGSPNGGLLLGRDGAIYGTTYSGMGDQLFGTVFRLAPPAAGQSAWQFETLHIFRGGNDGIEPNGGLIKDKSGNLFGTSTTGGAPQGQGFGVVFELSPPSAGTTAWTFQTLSTFGHDTISDGALPGGPLVRGRNGVLYGVTAYGGGDFDGGTVYAVTPPVRAGAKWTRQTIWRFGGFESTPLGALVFGNDGALYGTTNGIQVQDFGSVFRLVAQGPNWLEQPIHLFDGYDGTSPAAGLTPDGKGGFFGVATYVVFDISPPAQPLGKWSYRKLHDYRCTADTAAGCLTQGPLLLGKDQAIYGVNFLDDLFESGSVFRLVP